MADLLRQEIAASATSLVVKVGTRVLTHPDGSLDEEQVTRIADDISHALTANRRVALVSSGAVAAGMRHLEMSTRPTDLAALQAVAAIGQTKLIEAYQRAFARHGRHAAQILLTAGDLNHRTSYLNVRNTILKLLRWNVAPVINENDTVAVDELMTTFGDNDRLAAMVTNLIRAPLLVILSDVEGLYDGDPSHPDSKVISTVTQLDETIFSLARDKATGLSKGGMASKLQAARIATSAGENVIVASGRRPDTLTKILAGEKVGTLFLAQGKTISPYKRWIGFSARPRGQIIVDAGARRAVVEDGRSLLAIGVVEICGDFQKGDVVSLCGPDRLEFARGLSNYPAAEARKIQGLRSEQVTDVLGHLPYKAVVHRDNMMVLAAGEGR